MALKFRLRGLAETFVDQLRCPGCGTCDADDKHFSTEFTRVTFDGIIVVVQCRICNEISVPDGQRLGIIDPSELRRAVERDSVESGEPLMINRDAVKLNVERMNALRRGHVC
jgi:hypothetical protein